MRNRSEAAKLGWKTRRANIARGKLFKRFIAAQQIGSLTISPQELPVLLTMMAYPQMPPTRFLGVEVALISK